MPLEIKGEDVYLDPDIYVTSQLEELTNILGKEGDIILTPHLLAPIFDDMSPSEHSIMKAGVYNLGFLGLIFFDQQCALLNLI